MLARRLARAALCGPFVGTPRCNCDRGMTRTARESSERPGFSSRASGGLVRRSGKAATQNPKALAEGESRSARRAAAAAEKCISLRSSGRRARTRILGRYAPQRHALDTRAGPRPRCGPSSKSKNSLQRGRGRVYAPYASVAFLPSARVVDLHPVASWRRFAAVSRAFQESLHAPRTLNSMNEVLFRIRRRRILRRWARGRLDYSDAWRQLQRLTRS